MRPGSLDFESERLEPPKADIVGSINNLRGRFFFRRCPNLVFQHGQVIASVEARYFRIARMFVFPNLQSTTCAERARVLPGWLVHLPPTDGATVVTHGKASTAGLNVGYGFNEFIGYDRTAEAGDRCEAHHDSQKNRRLHGCKSIHPVCSGDSGAKLRRGC